MTEAIYAVGDIHGHLDQLEIALDRIYADSSAAANIVFLGDYGDRGPASAQVVDLLLEAETNKRPWTMLKGNHDTYLALFLASANDHVSKGRPDLSWFDPVGGGAACLESYGVDVEGRAICDVHADALDAIPQAHISFLDRRPLYHETSSHFFVHAGIRPGVAFEDQVEDDLIWIRKEFLDDSRDHGKLVVHGHTAIKYPRHHGNRVNLDGGAGWGRPVYPAVFEGPDVYLLTENGRERLIPND